MKALIIIPARGGSKGIPRKNVRPFAGKPLIYYTIEVARRLAPDSDICVSTEDEDIINVVESYGLSVPFKRPLELSTDTAGMSEVILHALDFYESRGANYDIVVLLQTTSPFRTVEHVKMALQEFNKETDMVVSVKESSSNPYYNLFEEDSNGFLSLSKKKKNEIIVRRQDAPKVYEYNGAIYVINPKSLKYYRQISLLPNIKKFVMDPESSLDLDTEFDWKIAEMIEEDKKKGKK